MVSLSCAFLCGWSTAVWAQKPGSAEDYLKLGIAFYSAGHPHDAVEQLRKALKLDPGSVQAHSYLGVSLSESGQCREALPYLKKDLRRTADRRLERVLGLGGVRCSVELNQLDDAIDFIRVLNRDFPGDPEILYRSVHVYSDLSTRASQDLLFKAPASYQVHELNAEALETQGKWDEAAGEYRKVLEQNPNLPGIHYRLGRLLLSAPERPTTMDEARKEFEEELKIDPDNAAAEFVLGELALKSEKVDEAIGRYSRAVKLDAGFADAYVGLGKALGAAGRTQEAVRPLETAVRLQPANPVTHYRLSIAYSHAGRKADAQKELALFKELSGKAQKANDTIQRAVQGLPPN